MNFVWNIKQDEAEKNRLGTHCGGARNLKQKSVFLIQSVKGSHSLIWDKELSRTVHWEDRSGNSECDGLVPGRLEVVELAQYLLQ